MGGRCSYGGASGPLSSQEALGERLAHISWHKGYKVSLSDSRFLSSTPRDSEVVVQNLLPCKRPRNHPLGNIGHGDSLFVRSWVSRSVRRDLAWNRQVSWHSASRSS